MSEVVSKNHELDHPVRSLNERTSVEHKEKTFISVKSEYQLIDAAMKAAGINNPVIFNENLHCVKNFENNVQRHRFWSNIYLSVPIDIIKYSPGGSILTTHCLMMTSENRSQDDILTDSTRFFETVRPNLKEIHTRAMKRQFKNTIQNVASIQPAILDFVYAELSMDRSAPLHPDIQQRIRMMVQGEPGLIADMRHLNPGRPSDHFDVFFEKLIGHIESVTAADDRRHGEAHMSKFISLDDLISQVASICPENTPIPNKALVRLQFMPTNPYTARAQNFTSKVPVQRKIQRRQLRACHEDDHYCNALFKYLKHLFIELGQEAALYSCDDKAKVKLGEPNCPVSTGVRGRQSIAPKDATLVALDHDMVKATLTPSVILQITKKEIPSVTDSFVRGKVSTTVNDTVFSRSSPMRHAAMLKKVMLRDGAPNILLKYTDGGTDQRNTLEAVKCANICLFKEFSLDMLITVRCAPGQSYINPAERVMSILNYGLQNVATERKKMDDETEALLKRCNSSNQIREKAREHPFLVEKWKSSVAPVQELLSERFRRLSLKDEPITTIDQVLDSEIESLQSHLTSLFPTLDLEKLKKAECRKCKEYVDWKKEHCRETQYTFQIRKCNDPRCCPPKQSHRDLSWLPEPVLDSSKEHYKPYLEVKGQQTDESDRPSLKPSKAGKKTKKATATSAEKSTAATFENPFQSAQTARATVTCTECQKPRVVYSNKKLSSRQEVLLAVTLSEYEYSCGSELFPPNEASILQSLTIKSHLSCNQPIEVAYYGSDVGRKDLCAYCASANAHKDAALTKKFKTVLPICEACIADGKDVVTQRPYGKSAKSKK